jgi:large subunit ribosomal protein L4
MELKLSNEENGLIEVNDGVFNSEFKSSLIHQVVVSYQARQRAGTKAQKSRSEVRGGGRKPWKQKGTGRARAGTIRSPLWRGGGVTFAAKPRDYALKVNKKMYGGAMRSMLSELLRLGHLIVMKDFGVESNKTKDLVAKLKSLNLGSVLIVTEEVGEDLYLAARNLYKVEVCDVLGVNPLNLISFEKVLFTVPALKQIERILA